MAIEARIVEQLQELRRWQLEQQQKLIDEQREQREILSSEQNRMYHALSLSIEEMSLDDEALKQLIDQHKKEGEENKEKNLIDLDTPVEESKTPLSQTTKSFTQYYSANEDNNNEINLKVPKVQLAVRNTNDNNKPSNACDNSFNQNDCSTDFSNDGSDSFCVSKSRKSLTIDDMPVPSPKKDFVQLLEERLKDSEAVTMENKSKPVVKRPFLKKGQGLARFMPNSHNSNGNKNTDNNAPKTRARSKSASFTSSTASSIAKCTKPANVGKCNSVPKSKTEPQKKANVNVPPVVQQKLNLKAVAPPAKRISKSIGGKPSAISMEKKKSLEISSDGNNSSDIDSKNKREIEETRIFELLEDKAENSSFCSTSSTVIAFLQQSSTPLKAKALLHSASKHKISLDDLGNSTMEEIVRSTKRNQSWSSQQRMVENQPNVNKEPHSNVGMHWDSIPLSKLKNDKTITGTVLPFGTDMDSHYEFSSRQDEDTNLSLHVRFAEYNEYKTMTDTSSVCSDSQTIIEHTTDNGAWSESSATPDTSDAESVTFHSKIIDELKKKAHLGYSKNKQTYSDDDDDNGDDDDTTLNYKDEENQTEMDNVIESDNDMESRNATLQKDDTVIEEKSDQTALFKSELLKQRLVELEREIEIFRRENAGLAAQRQKLQEERTKLQEERIALQRLIKEKEEAFNMAKRQTETILQEERKRLAREKAALENRMKDAYDKAQKSKHDRHELQVLKDEIEELKEEFSQKESKWSATNARQRSQMRVLQTENSKLKQELEKLQQKKNGKIKRPTSSSNTKAIHQINKYLAERKKTSPFKNDDLPYEEEPQIPDCDVDFESVENENQEREKVTKTVESIARTRNLYESLLKDATDGLSETSSIRRNQLIDDQSPNEIQSEEEIAPYDTVLVTGLKKISPSKSSRIKQNFQERNNENNNSDDKRPVISKQNTREVQLSNEENNPNNSSSDKRIVNDKQNVREVHHSDGRSEFWYPNGNVKKLFPDKGLTKMIYYNGDVRETNKNGTVKYFYAATRTWHTTMPDGLEILEFPDGQVERRSKNGVTEVTFPDGSVRIVQADGSEKWALRDGTVAETSATGEKILVLPNGQREIHTKDHKRREYPDGTVKFVFPDGSQETRYSNGRIRIKDKDGNLIMDSYQ